MFRWWSALRRERIALLGACAALAAPFLPGASLAQPPIGSGACQCRAEGQSYIEGQTACLRLNGQSDTYRCEKVQNVTSWKKIVDGCPQS
jgi:hypothetical protein